ncbi:MAG TPA: YHS domain-containing protein [Spirochaetia bacterium]|nr:YHS domain-containing protein [Spirochaetia bacterium]
MSADSTKVKDVVCGMMVDPSTASARRIYETKKYHFCSLGCAKAFDADPKRYITAGT